MTGFTSIMKKSTSCCANAAATSCARIIMMDTVILAVSILLVNLFLRLWVSL